MKDKWLATLPLSKEVLERMPEVVVALLLRLLSRVEELERRLNKHSGNSDKPPSCDSPFRKRKEEKPAKKTSRKRAGFRQQLLPSRPEVAACGLWALNEPRRLCHMGKEAPIKGKRTYPYLVEAFERHLSGKRLAALFCGTHESCHSLNPAQSLLSLSLSLSL